MPFFLVRLSQLESLSEVLLRQEELAEVFLDVAQSIKGIVPRAFRTQANS
jgi:hypothetical protein